MLDPSYYEEPEYCECCGQRIVHRRDKAKRMVKSKTPGIKSFIREWIWVLGMIIWTVAICIIGMWMTRQ